MVSRFLLCGLPLRIGALLVSAVQLLVFGVIAAGGFYTVTTMRGRLPRTLKGVIISNAFYYTLLAFAALTGVIGTLMRKVNLLSTYSFYLSYSIGVQIVIDAIVLWAFFSHKRETLIQRCIDGSTDQDVRNICNRSFDTGKWTLLVSMVIGLIIQIWAAYVVTSYSKKLKDDQAWRSGPGVVVQESGASYSHLKHGDHELEVHIPLNHASYAYPYSDTNHSFGTPTHHHHHAHHDSAVHHVPIVYHAHV